MALPPFAMPAELSTLVQGALDDAAATRALASASALIRSWTRQVITRMVDDTVTLRAPAGRELVLPQRPVVSVSHVEAHGIEVVGWALSGDRLLWSGSWQCLPGRTALVDPGTVTVTYTHGWAEVPEDVRAVCLDIAAMTVTNPGGLREVAIDDYRRTFAAETIGSGVLSEAHKEILAAYRRRIGTVSLR